MQVRSYHFQRASKPGSSNDKRTNWTGTRHKHPFARQRPGLLNGMESHRQRLAARRLSERHLIAHRLALVFLDHNEFAEGALAVRDAHGAAVKPHVQAMLMLACLAKFALAARPTRVKRDSVSRFNALHVGTHGLHCPRHFVPKHDRLLDANNAKAAMQVVVQVGPANTSRTNPYEHLVILHFGNRNRFQPQVFFRV
jgi:hypothetical protein